MALAAYFTSAHAHAQRPKCSRTHVAPVQPGNRRVRADFLGVHQRRTRYGTGGCVAGSSSCHLGRDPRHEDAESQVGVDPAEFGADGERRQSRYEHAWEVRDDLGYTEFESAEEQVRAGVGVVGRAAVAVRPDGGVAGGASGSAPGITTLTRLVAEVRRAENARLYGLLAGRTPAETAAAWSAAGT